MAWGKSSYSAPKTSYSTKKASTKKTSSGGGWGSFWKPPAQSKPKAVYKAPVKAKPVYKAPVKVKAPVYKAPVKAQVKAPVKPVIQAGMPTPVAQAIGQAAQKKAAQVQVKSKAAPIVKQTAGTVKKAAPIVKAPTYTKAAAPVVKSAYTKSLPKGPVYKKSLPVSKYTKTAPSKPGGGTSGGTSGGSSGGGTKPVVTTPTKPPAVPTKPPVVAAPTTPKPVTTPATGQTGSDTTRGGAGTRGSFNRRRLNRGPRSGLSMTPQMLMRLAGQRITNPR